jgi:3-hydroxyacyl-[acyl-carrier-protein] dehydratase
MLLNDFYEITGVMESEAAHRIRVKLNPSHRIYEGHFTGQPVVPGVCTLQIIKDCVEKLSGKEYMYSYISSSKFLSLVDPKVNNLVEFDISLKETEDRRTSLLAEGKYQNTDTIFIKVKATLKEIENE